MKNITIRTIKTFEERYGSRGTCDQLHTIGQNFADQEGIEYVKEIVIKEMEALYLSKIKMD